MDTFWIRFFQAVSAYAVAQINVFRLVSMEDVKLFWEAMELAEEWSEINAVQ